MKNYVRNKYGFKLFLLDSIKYLFPFILLGILYLIGSFVAFSFNIMDWWIFYSGVGRVVAIILFGIYLRMLATFYWDM